LSTIDEEIASIKQRINAAQIAKVRADAAKENAENNFETGMLELRSKHGLDSLQDVRAKLAELQQDLQSKKDEVSTILDEINL
jgi:predicted  nucleic acid-binding Zn-ribbon protein